MSSGRFWLDSGGFGWVRVVSAGFGWFRAVSCFSNNGVELGGGSVVLTN